MVEGGGELVQARDTFAADGDEGIDGDEKDTGGLAQARLRNGEVILSEFMDRPRCEKRKRAGRRICPPLMCPATMAGTSLMFSCQTLMRWRPSANSPLGC